MKKTIRTLTVMAMAILMLTIAAIPALAAGFDFETAISKFQSTPLNTITLEVSKTHTPTAAVWAKNGAAACYSSDEAVVTVAKDGTVTAVGAGTAYVAIDAGSMYELYCYIVPAENNDTTGAGSGNENGNDSMWDKYKDKVDEMQQFVDQASKENNQILQNAQDRMDGMFIFMMILIIVAVLLGVAAVIYIFIEAPKCGMSRLWALVPLFSNLLGLIVFIVIRSSRKQKDTSHTITCPTCNGVHPAGTTECSICGTKLQ